MQTESVLMPFDILLLLSSREPSPSPDPSRSLAGSAVWVIIHQTLITHLCLDINNHNVCDETGCQE